MRDSHIECVSLTKHYRSKNHVTAALIDINLKISKNEMVLIKGRSGAGKSTLLNIMCGLIKPTSGKVVMEGQSISDLNNHSLSNLLLNKIGIIFQSFNLLSTYNLYENIEVALAPKRLGKKEILSLIMPLTDEFQLSDKLHLLPAELSVGQQQKVAIIRTLVKQPTLIFADEPTGSVDSETASEILKYFKNLQKEKGITIVLSSHGSIPDSFADRVVVLENGKIN